MANGIHAGTVERRSWEEWRVQPEPDMVADFIAKVFAGERQKNPSWELTNHIMGHQVQRKRYTGMAIAGLLELDAQLQQTTEPAHQDNQPWGEFVASGESMNDRLRVGADSEGRIPPEKRTSIITGAGGAPDRTVYLARLADEAFAEQRSGMSLVLQDAILALQLDHQSMDKQQIAAQLPVPTQPSPPPVMPVFSEGAAA